MEPKHDSEPRQMTSNPSRKPYSAPVLEIYGDVRDLTLGGTKGSGDSISPSSMDFV
jgi:hypothetical protein